MKTKPTRAFLMNEPEPHFERKQRSKRPRRIRSWISPVLNNFFNSNLLPNNKGVPDISVDSSSCSYLGEELSCDSSRVTVGPSVKKRRFLEVGGNNKVEDAAFRRITRSFYKQKERERKGVGVEVSESSCVESNSGTDCGFLVKRSSKLNNISENVKEIQVNEGYEAVSKLVIAGADHVSRETLNSESGSLKIQSKVKGNKATSKVSGAELPRPVEIKKSFDKITRENDSIALEFELSEISRNDSVSVSVSENFTASNTECVAEQRAKSLEFESNLACTEHLSYGDISDYSLSHETSQLQSEIFPENSETDFSDFSPSFLDSNSEFSERSNGDTSPSQTYSLFLEFREQFSRTSTLLDCRKSSAVGVECLDRSVLVRFEDEEDEVTYQRLRDRERRQVFLYDYGEEYRSTTEYGDLVVQQRSQMVHWIVEMSTAKEFQQETMFLGVSLLDRFLAKGFFKNKRKLQIVGIACLALATRIEENQPYNSVQQKSFSVGSNVYSRCEVVAMEWLVQEVLNFQCFLPTIYNFMWFYLKAARADVELEKRAKSLAVLALSYHEQLRYWPSTVAAGLVILASPEGNQDTSHKRVIEIHFRTKDDNLPECMKSLEWLLLYVR